jgi:hypothetical protein
MELASTELAALGAVELVRASVSIPRAAPRTLALLTACLVLPLSFAVLVHSLFTDPILILLRIQGGDGGVTYSDLPQWLIRLIAYQVLYLMVLYTFSILSTAAAVFTVASLYANKPASISSSLTALPAILPRLLDTFAWVPLFMFAYHTVFGLIIVFIPNAFESESAPLPLSFLLCLVVVVFVFLGIHVYISALWHLASVISVLEPLCGLAALAKSKRLLQGCTGKAATLVASYLA